MSAGSQRQATSTVQSAVWPAVPAHSRLDAVIARMPEPPARVARRSRRRSLLSIVGVLLLWEIVGRYLVTNPILFAPLSKVLGAGWALLISGELVRHLTVSSIEFGIGFGLATLFGVALGFLMATNRAAHDILDPWVAFLYSSPLVALIPFFILVFGVGMASKIAIIFTVAIFPILLNAFVGIRSADAALLEVGAAFNCSRWQVFSKILFPAALPAVIVGLRLGIGRALTGVVVSELFGSTAGLGWLIGTAGQSFDTPTVLFGVLMFSAVGVAMVEALKWIEHAIAPWRKATQEVR